MVFDRALAFSIDAMIVLVGSVIVWNAQGNLRLNEFGYYCAVIGGGYFTWFHGARGETLGNKLFGVRVERSDGTRLGYGRAFLRFCLFALTLAPLLFWIGLFDRKRRMLHDRFSGSVVVRVAHFKTTPQAQVSEFAGFWIRCGAFVVDCLVMLTLWCPWLLLRVRLSEESASLLNHLFIKSLDQWILPLIAVAYCSLFVGLYGSTIGKMAFEIAVSGKDGVAPGWKLAFVRALVFWSGIFLASAIADYGNIQFQSQALRMIAVMGNMLLSLGCWIFFFGGPVLAAFDPEKRALHDRICGTRVIYLR